VHLERVAGQCRRRRARPLGLECRVVAPRLLARRSTCSLSVGGLARLPRVRCQLAAALPSCATFGPRSRHLALGCPRALRMHSYRDPTDRADTDIEVAK
jgi:hypothetical protein